MADDYSRMLAKDPDDVPTYGVLGAAPSILANRVSWYYDLHGPSIHVDTACSSSMVAVDLACQSIINGDSSMVRSTQGMVETYFPNISIGLILVLLTSV